MNSLWINSIDKIKDSGSLQNEEEADVCIIGAGIFGITCAYYLTKLGYKVIVIDKYLISEKTSGHTTAKITSQHGLFYNYLMKSYGLKYAKDYLEANEEAITNISNIINDEKIKCDFKSQNSYVYTTEKSELSEIKSEISSLEKLNFNNCEFVTKTGLPFEIIGAICFKNQAQFNPLQYIQGLCNYIITHNGKIFTNTTVTDVKQNDNLNNNYFLTYTSNAIVKSKYTIIASHYPFINFPGFYFTKMYQETSYVIAIDPKKTLFNGMYINIGTNLPTLSFRTAKYLNKNVLLISGGNHKTGYPSTYEDTYGYLENTAKKYYPNCEILFRWSTEDCISLDKIPYIGLYSNTISGMFVATGFKKWGMTISNVAANIIVDHICGIKNKYSYLFDSTRIKPLKNADEFKNMIVQSSKSLLLDKLKISDLNFENIPLNSGGIININNEKVGIYKDTSGNIYPVKPICTHLGCLLSWNNIDKTWDCPCHGSRFNFKGENIYNPAFKNLEIYDL